MRSRISARLISVPPWKAYAVSQYWHRRSQPVNRTNTQGFPACVDSPWMLSKISVTRTPRDLSGEPGQSNCTTEHTELTEVVLEKTTLCAPCAPWRNCFVNSGGH